MKLLTGFYAVVLLTSFPALSVAGTVKLDLRSMECINCHEAAVTDTNVTLLGGPGGHDHPVGVDYVSLATRNPTLVKPLDLDPAVALVNGRISCVTCHVPYSEADHLNLVAKRKRMPAIPDPMLTVDNSTSGLCISCHIK